MNREIKFRIYSKDYGMQYPNKYLLSAFDFGVGTEHYIDDSTSSYPITDKDNNVMQFTGIKRDDGKELYEGDIIEFRANYVPMGKPSGYLTGVVVWDYCEWVIKVGEHNYSIKDETDEFYYKWELKGNIFENPELCDGKN